MTRLSGRPGRALVAALLLAATIVFAIGISIEKSEEGEHSEPAAAHSESGERSGASEAAESSEATEPAHADEETILGIDAELTPIIVVGIVASLLLAGAAWRYGNRREVLVVVAIFCVGFAVLDSIEASRKLGEEDTIAALAVAALILHVAAAGAALLLLRAGPAAEGRVVGEGAG